MYVLGDEDRAVEESAMPVPSPDVTEPSLLADDHRVVFAYRTAVAQPSDQWRLMESEGVAVCRFECALGVYFGAPNDEALANHPLFGRGLSYYGVYEVAPSSWAASLKELAIKKGSNLDLGTLRHFAITMDDSIFEVVCGSVSVELATSSPREAAADSFAAWVTA